MSINKLLNAALTETLLNEEDYLVLNPQRKDHPFMPSNSDMKSNNLPSEDLPRVSSEDPSYIDRLKSFYNDHKLDIEIGGRSLAVGLVGTALAAGLGVPTLAKKLREKKLAAANKKNK